MKRCTNTRTTTLTIAALLAAVAGLVLTWTAGCSIDGPVGDGRQTVALHVEGRLPAGDSAKLAPPTLEEILRKTERLVAVVTIERLNAAGDVVEVAGGGVMDEVTLDEERSLLRFEGVVDLEPGLVGSRYRLHLDLRSLGDNIAGAYRGWLVLASGITVSVDSLRIGSLIPTTGGRLGTRDLHLCLSSSALDEVPGCVTGADLEADGLVYDPEADLMTLAYRRAGVEWEDFEEPRTILVSLEGRLQASPVMEGTAGIGPLVPGDPEPLEIAIHLVPTLGDESGPGRPGERLTGVVNFEFEDGRPPRETGTFVLVRTEPL
jgi:hypothetical protein